MSTLSASVAVVLSFNGDVGRPGLSTAAASVPGYGGGGFPDSAVGFPDCNGDFSGRLGGLSGRIGSFSETVGGFSDCTSGLSSNLGGFAESIGGFSGSCSGGCGGGRSVEGVDDRDERCDSDGDTLLTLCAAVAGLS